MNILAIILLVVLMLFSVTFLLLIKLKKFTALKIIIFLMLAALLVSFYYYSKFDEFLDKITKKYYIVSVEEINIDEITKVIGILKSDEGNVLIPGNNYYSYKEFDEMKDDLDDKYIYAMIINESYLDDVKGYYVQELTSKEVKKGESFNIYLSGKDNNSDIDQKGRSDFNLIATINPSTKTVLLTSIPRDSYVPVYGSYDKLTHVSLFGIYESINSITKVMDVPIDYYMKVNFETLVKLVDTIDGITIYNPTQFTTYGKNFKKGYINLNGKDALSYSRARKNFTNGDFQRNINQQTVIKGILEKLKSFKAITEYDKILNSLSSTFETNVTKSMIYDNILLGTDWKIESQYVEGTTGYRYTYSYPNQELSVVLPYESSYKKCEENILKILG